MGSIPIDDTEGMRQNISAPAHLYKPLSLSLFFFFFFSVYILFLLLLPTTG
jgi:hypothetical protein